MSAKLKNLWPQKKSICFYNSPNFLVWKHGCVWCVATILFECGNMWRKYPLDSLLDFFCTPTLPFLIQHDMKKVGGEERKEKLFFPHFFLPSFVNIKRHRTTRKKSQHSSEIQTSTLKKFYSINIPVEVSIVRSPAI